MDSVVPVNNGLPQSDPSDVLDPTVPVQNAQDADNEMSDSQIAGPSSPNVNEPEDPMTECLRTHVILRKIFQCLSTEALHDVVSYVSSLWEFEAQTMIWNRSEKEYVKLLSIAEGCGLPPALESDCHESSVWPWINLLKSEHGDSMMYRDNLIVNTKAKTTCEEIQDFVDVLVNTSYAGTPLCGIYLKLVGPHGDSCPSASEMDKLRSTYHSGPQPTHLAVHYGRGWHQHQGCPGFVLLTQLLRAGADGWHIQKFSLLVSSKRQRFLQTVLQDYTFEHVDTLLFRDVDLYTTSLAYANFIKALVSRTPNLKTLYTQGRVDLSANLLGGLPEGSRAVHRTDYPYSPSHDEIPENAVDSLRMKKIKLQGIGEDFDLEKFDRITPRLLKACAPSLSSMTIDMPFLLPLMAYGVHLKRVLVMKIVFDTNCFSESGNQDAWNLIKSFDFNRLLPSLFLVRIRLNWEAHLSHKNILNAFISKLSLMQESVAPDRAVNITGLNLECGLGEDLTERGIGYLARMFPNVQSLMIRATGIISFDGIWRSWPDLQRLDIRLIGAEHDPSFNLDCVFCGIFPEEVAELREMDDEYLKAVHIVPVMPSFTSLKNLDTLDLYLEANCHIVPFDAENPTFFLSKVTPLTAFRNLPFILLSTTDECIPGALSHLLPYVHWVSSGHPSGVTTGCYEPWTIPSQFNTS